MFNGILGNDDLKKVLARLRSNGRMPNAVLFAGPDGIGKRLFALEVGRSFVCVRDEDSACGACAACVRAGQFELPKPDDKEAHKKVTFTNHPDIGLVVPYGRQIPVDAVRDLEREAHFRPYEGRGRTFIIDDADKMNPAASNALLKTLEEPAPTSHIILVTSRPDSLLSTIRSRCQTFRFAPIAAELIQKHLTGAGWTDENAARLAARMSQGSLGRALSFDVGRVRERRAAFVTTMADALVRHEVVNSIRMAESMAEARNKEHFEDDLELLLTLLRDVWAIALGGSEGALVHIDIFHDLERIAENADPDRIAALMGEIELMRERFAVNLNRKLAADTLFTAMAA